MNVGDKVICVRKDKGFDSLTIGKEYCILGFDEVSAMYSSIGIYILIRNDKDFEYYYYYNKFISISGYRKKKLERLALIGL